jgi:hypothetical protein
MHKSIQPSLDNSPLYWSVWRCQAFLLDRGVWVGNWPDCAESCQDCLATIRAACAQLTHGEDPSRVVEYVRRNCELSADMDPTCGWRSSPI